MGPMPFGLQQMLNHINTQPSDVKARNTTDVQVQKRYLWTKLYSVFDFKIPKAWDLDWFRFWLFQYGSIASIYTKEFGWICYPYGIQKLDIYYKPAEISVTCSQLNEVKTGIVGVNAVIIHIMDDMFGLDDLVTKYAVMLSEIDRAISINGMTCNTSLLFEAENKKEAETIKEAYAASTEGDPLVVVNKDITDGRQLVTLVKDVKSNYIINDLLDARRGIINAFLTEIGIANANYQKKERLNTQEVNENNDETKAIVTIILENLQKCFDELNAISDLGLAVELREYEGGEEDEVYTVRDV